MDFKKLTILSGGQTGVDRAALDFAFSNKIQCGGWCPNGRKAEDGIIPIIYPLKETLTSDYSERTQKNIEESDGTLIILDHTMDQGTALTKKLCTSLDKPNLIIQIDEPSAKTKITEWMKANKISILNIAGPRESSDPGIYMKTLRYLAYLFQIS